MRAKHALYALMISSVLMLAASQVVAQSRTTGVVRGVITDQSGETVAGATVIIGGPALQGTQAEISDSAGQYTFANLPPGTYVITVHYSNIEFQRPNALVQLGKVSQVNIQIDTGAGKGEIIQIEGRIPVIDQGSTKTGRTITPDYTQNIPTGRTFSEVLGAAAGSQGDRYGVSFGGSTSVENVYIVEGLNTTDPAYGLLSSNLPNEFIQETEIISGGYNAEYGRSTGGVVSVVTKSGSNQFRGSVFGTFTPGALVAAEVPTPRSASSIDRVDELAYRWDVGAELGGPVLKDKVWFHVGFNPSFQQYKVHRLIKSQVDENQDGVPDTDASGFTILEEVGRKTLRSSGRTTFFTSKITAAISPDHQGSLSVFGNPDTSGNWSTVTGVERAGKRDIESGAYDVALKWTSKFNNNKTQIDVVTGGHRNFHNQIPTSEGNTNGIRWEVAMPLTDFDAYEGYIPDECWDGSESDKYPGIVNCQVIDYQSGGNIAKVGRTTDRLSALLSVTQRVKALGHHTFKGGIDVEQQTYDHLSHYSGGEFFRYRRERLRLAPGEDPVTIPVWRTRRYYTLKPNADEGCDLGGPMLTPCEWQANGLTAVTDTRNLGAYVQDSWAPLPNLTINAGLRWERQTLFVAESLRNQVGIDGNIIDPVAFELSHMLAPRLGVIYDPTQEGRSRVFAHWGRFYESIPMDINARGFGGEVIGQFWYDARTDACMINPGEQSLCDGGRLVRSSYLGGEELVVPGIKGQYLDEMVIGGEYELFSDLKVGASYIRRDLGRAIEDISTDGGATYMIANPGEYDAAAIADLRARGEHELADLFEASSIFDKPTRRYDALQLTAEKRFSRNLMLQASYTYSRLHGNFPGLFSPETGQLDPNLTSMYDLPELMANRTGRLAADRPHQGKLDGYYSMDVDNVGHFVFGTSVRAASGIPRNHLGAHTVYGRRESYILPRGTADRSPLTTRFDVHIAYGRTLRRDMKLEAFLDVFNLFNQQPPINVDEEYTFQAVDPIVGGDANDLKYLTVQGSGEPVEVNPNFHNASTRQAPLSMRFGMRLTF